MKITPKKLKQIIKEEYEKAVQERLDSTTPLWKQSDSPPLRGKGVALKVVGQVRDILDNSSSELDALYKIEKLLAATPGSERVDLKPKDEPAEEE